MNLLGAVRDFWLFSQPHRHRFGQMAGLELAWRLRHWVYPPGTEFSVSVPGVPSKICLRAGTSDVMVFEQIFLSEEMDFSMRSVPKLIIDAGANIGLSSIYLSRKFPKARIVALEPEAENFELLKRNVKAYPNVVPVNQALWSSASTVQIVDRSVASWAFQVQMVTSKSEGAVISTSVAELVREFGAIDLLKMDIEGSELEVLSHGTDRWVSSVGMIAVELHDRFQPGCSEALASLLEKRSSAVSRRGEYTIVDFH